MAIFKYLKQGLGKNYFPAWIGFFAYEYAQHLGLPTHKALVDLPEAAFYYYPDGRAYLKGKLVQDSKISLVKQTLRQVFLKSNSRVITPKQNF